MSCTTVVFHLSEDRAVSCVLSSTAGRTIGRVTPQRPLQVVLPAGTHVLRAVSPLCSADVDVCVADVDRQEVHLTVGEGGISVARPPRRYANESCSQRTS